MRKIKQFEDLDIWKLAIEISIDIYKVSEEGKLKQDWGLKDQIRRAAMSISNNIAEGFEYDNNKDFIKFLRYSKGSAGEVRSQLFALRKIEFISEDFYNEMFDKLISISKQISGLIKYLKEYEKKNKKQISTT